MIISIITINYNNALGLKKTIQSVLSQNYRHFEYIIVDGGSQDNSPSVILDELNVSYLHDQSNDLKATKGSKNIDGIRIKWVSERDEGIYDAMNKGINLSEGKYLQFLNSGDTLVNNSVVENVINYIDSETEIAVGNVIYTHLGGANVLHKNHGTPSLFMLYTSTIHHTSAFIKKELFEIYGFYDSTLKIVSDWKWYLITVVLNDVKVSFIPVTVSYFDTSGISSTNKNLDSLERREVLNDLIPNRILIDYDKYHFDIIQLERIKRYRLLYKLFWITERVLFKLEKHLKRQS